MPPVGVIKDDVKTSVNQPQLAYFISQKHFEKANHVKQEEYLKQEKHGNGLKTIMASMFGPWYINKSSYTNSPKAIKGMLAIPKLRRRRLMGTGTPIYYMSKKSPIYKEEKLF